MFSENSIRLGYYTSNEHNPRAIVVPLPTYEAFVNQLRTVLGNPAPIKAMVRARVSAMFGGAFDFETDDWIFVVCALGSALWGVPDPAELELLRAELL